MTDVHENMLDRLFLKYKDSSNILGIVAILAEPLQDTNDVLDWILANINLDTEEDDILDKLGEIIGVARPYAQETKLFQSVLDCELADDPYNDHGFVSETDVDGGYIPTNSGLQDQEYLDLKMSNVDYRHLIQTKAATYRRQATRENLYETLLELGHRCRINESQRLIEIEPSSYADMSPFERWYIENKCFKPAGIRVKIQEQTTPTTEI